MLEQHLSATVYELWEEIYQQSGLPTHAPENVRYVLFPTFHFLVLRLVSRVLC